MADFRQSVLLSFAEYSNACSIIVVIVCLFCMVVFILRLNTEHFGGRSEPNPGLYIPSQVMRGVHNPFTCTLDQPHKSSLKDGATLTVTSHVGCRLQAFWGVTIKDLYPKIYLPWSQFLHRFDSEQLLEDISIVNGQRINLECCEKVSIHLPPPQDSEGDMAGHLGVSPRSCYPLVVVLLAQEGEDCIRNDCIVSMVTILHLSDKKCPNQSHVIGQYVRTPQGRPYNLQQLFMAANEGGQQPDLGDVSSSSGHSSESCEPMEELDSDTDRDPTTGCIVCQTAPINRVLLPCRHACVCDTCFIRLDKCPMCRGFIHSSFQLQDSGDTQNLYSNTTPVDTGAAASQSPAWWVRLNQSIDEIFGFS